jgi:hypothetical protein
VRRRLHFRLAHRHDRLVAGQKPPRKVTGVARRRCYSRGRRRPARGPIGTSSNPDSSGRSSGGLEERRAATSNGRRDERRTHKPKPPIDPMFRMIAGAGTLEGSFHLLRYGNVSGKSGPRQKPIDTLRRRVAYRFLSGERGAPSKAYERRMGEIPFKVSASEPSKG